MLLGSCGAGSKEYCTWKHSGMEKSGHRRPPPKPPKTRRAYRRKALGERPVRVRKRVLKEPRLS